MAGTSIEPDCPEEEPFEGWASKAAQAAVIEGDVTIEINLEDQCLMVKNCDGEVLTVELSAENIAELIAALEAADLSVTIVNENPIEVTLPDEFLPAVVSPCWECVQTAEGVGQALATNQGWFELDPVAGLVPVTVLAIADPCDPGCAPVSCPPVDAPEAMTCLCLVEGECVECAPAEKGVE